MRGTPATLSFAALAACVVGACTNATGTVTGSDNPAFDAAPPPAAPSPPEDAAPPPPTADAGPATTWTELYKDYFGPMGTASCAGSVGACHGEMAGAGYQGSLYLCPPGDQTGCYMGITSQGVVPMPLLDPRSSTPFDMTGLFLRLRKTQGANSQNPPDPMPHQVGSAPPYTFTVADVAKISSWVAAGTKND